MKVLCIDKSSKFISIKFHLLYKKREIIIEYAALYMHKENEMAKQG